MTEEQLQAQVAAYLDLTGLCWFHPANERKCTPQAGARLKRAGVKPGVPDVLIFEPFEDEDGQPFAGLAIELKTPGNYPTPAQREWADKLAFRGWAVIPRATTLDEIIQAVKLCYPEAARKVRI